MNYLSKTNNPINLRFNNYAKPTEGYISESIRRHQALIERENIRGWYQWKVFVDEDENILDKIEYVEYLLHPSYSEQRQISSDKNSKFAIEECSWAEFALTITVKFKNGTKQEYFYNLDLSKSWPEDESVKEAPKESAKEI